MKSSVTLSGKPTGRNIEINPSFTQGPNPWGGTTSLGEVIIVKSRVSMIRDNWILSDCEGD